LERTCDAKSKNTARAVLAVVDDKTMCIFHFVTQSPRNTVPAIKPVISDEVADNQREHRNGAY